MGSSPPKPTEKEYGRRLYVSDLNYQGQIRKPTDKAFDDMYKLPHSENKKPYMEDDYGEMEYFQSPPFGFPWNFPDFDVPWQVPGEPITPPWLLVFTCQLELGGCFCAGEKRCYGLNCSHEVIEASVNTFLTPEPGNFKVTANAGQICITGNDDADNVVYIDILMVADPGDGSEVYGEYVGLSVSPCAEEVCTCGAAAAFSYDDASSGDVVSQSGNVQVYVSGGVSPYTWTITGTGLTLSNASTAGLQNQVNANASACGPGHIIITDACDQVTHGYVRTTEDSTWTGWGTIDEVLWEPCNTTWTGDSGVTVCRDPIFAYRAYWGGQIYSLGNPCPQSCRCEDYPIIATSGPVDQTLWSVGGDHGCDHTCTEQVGVRSLRYCNIKVKQWRCNP